MVGPVVGPPFAEQPGRDLPWDNRMITVTPARCAAPVGSRIILVAGVGGPDNFLRTNERVEWTVVGGGPGHFVEVDRGACSDMFFLDFTYPRIVSPSQAVTSTSRQDIVIRRNTAVPLDDVRVARGQTWVAVTSPVEGVTYVTAFAPSVYNWQRQRQTATIHWVDAQWGFPPPRVAPAGGRQVFTTTVTRQTNGSPRAGWIVRYQIAGGPPAGFAPGGTQSIDVTTNEAGQATVEIAQVEPVAGSNPVNIQIIRPGGIDGACGQPLVVGSGSTTATWSAPGLTIRKTGPTVGSVGATLSYQTAVTNSGDVPADGVTVLDEVPSGFELVRTNPQATRSGNQLRWNVGRLDARQTRILEVDLRATRAGKLTTCAEATASGGLRARHCATTTIGTPNLRLQILGPTTAKVGDEITYEIVIGNQGDVAATGLLLKDRFDVGLVFPGETSPIEKPLADLPPGLAHRVKATFRVTRPGTLSQDVELIGDQGIRVKQRASVEVVPAALPPATPPATLPGTPSGATPLRGQPRIKVEKVGPTTAMVGQKAQFAILVTNIGDVPLSDIRVVDSYDGELEPVSASRGNTARDNSLTWNLASLPIGAATRYNVECICRSPAAQTRNTVRVTTAEGLAEEAVATVEVKAVSTTLSDQPPRPQVSALSMVVYDLSDQIDVGKSFSYEIVVDNNSHVAPEDVSVVVDLPAGLEPIDIGTKGPGTLRHEIAVRTIRFEPVREMRGGDQLRYEVRAKGVSPGRHTVRARLTCKGMTQELVAEQNTEILGSP
ncbi:MAG: DUF11 domain-containing protein [Pirellulaceae bacterium]|nr:DUF11 domain-containing protein [Pirellulaceae bacterium]